MAPETRQTITAHWAQVSSNGD